MEAQWYIGGIEQFDGVDLGLLVMDMPDWKLHTEALHKVSTTSTHTCTWRYMTMAKTITVPTTFIRLGTFWRNKASRSSSIGSGLAIKICTRAMTTPLYLVPCSVLMVEMLNNFHAIAPQVSVATNSSKPEPSPRQFSSSYRKCDTRTPHTSYQMGKTSCEQR